MASEWKQINLRVRPSTYDEWKDAADSTYGTMTDLIRTGVRRELDGQPRASVDTPSPSSGDTVTDLVETVDTLQKTISSIDRRMDGLAQSVEGSGPSYSLKAAVRETLSAESLTASQIAARLDADVATVEESLDELETSEEARRAPSEGNLSGEDLAWVKW